jgi:hypothetical protein
MASGRAWALFGVLATASAISPRLARADGWEDRTAQGAFVGARFGGAIPFGHVSGNAASDVYLGGLAIWLDLGYRISKHLAIGGEVAYGITYIPNNGIGGCDGVTEDCTGHTWRFGASAIWHFLPCFRFDPWTSLGMGYEIFGNNATDADTGEDLGTAYLSGLQYAHVGLGVDYHVDRLFDIGPFVDFSAGDYNTDDSVHYWLTMGLRATVNP